MITKETPDPITQEQRTGNSLSYSVGTRILGDRWLRMWNGCASYDLRTRWQAASLSRELLTFTNDIDDAIDAPNLDQEARVGLIQSGANHLLAGRCDCENTCSSVMHAAREMHHDFIQQKPQIKTTFTELFEAGLAQLQDTSLPTQEEAAYIIGATCMRLSVQAGEHITRKTAPTDIVDAANALGAYSYLLDLAYEFESDIDNDSQNYATVLVQAGEYPAAVKRQLQYEATVYLDRGIDYLTPKQRRTYKTLAKLVQLKYILQGGSAWLI